LSVFSLENDAHPANSDDLQHSVPAQSSQFVILLGRGQDAAQLVFGERMPDDRTRRQATEALDQFVDDRLFGPVAGIRSAQSFQQRIIGGKALGCVGAVGTMGQMLLLRLGLVCRQQPCKQLAQRVFIRTCWLRHDGLLHLVLSSR
jgi:hypothetical protein